MTGIPITEQELAVHVFAHADGPHSAGAWQWVRAAWSRCRAAGLTEPVASLGLPAELPDTRPRDTTAVVAVCQSSDAGRQAVFRVEHDVLVVSLLVAQPGGVWSAAERELAELVGDQPAGIFGAAWLYLGKAADPRLPDTDPGWDTGTELETGLVARELGDRVATRVTRRLRILATPDRDAWLSEWTWSDTTTRMPRLARYLMHIAKVRYEARVHAGFPSADPLCRAVESALTGQPDAARRTRLTELAVEITRVLTPVRALLRTVEIARYNAGLVLDADVRTMTADTLFGDDEALARHLLFRLDDDRAYLENALDAARTVAAVTDDRPDRPTGGPTRAPTGLPTFGIVTALPEEFLAMRELLDGAAKQPPVADDPATYLIGTLPSAISGQPHTVVLTMLGETANNAAAAGTTNLTRSFGTINCALVVGIAAGVPNPGQPDRHVRLGDIVAAAWGVVDYDHVVDTPHGRQLRQPHPQPSPLLAYAAKLLVTEEMAGARPWDGLIDDAVTRLPAFCRPGPDTDVLYGADDDAAPLPHPDPADSGHPPGRPKVHLGRIGSADRSLRNLAERDALAARHDLRAIEMEATGVGKASFADGREWFVVRGVSDYGDRRTGGTWRKYASVAAAAYTRALLGTVPPLELRGDRFRLPEK